MKFKIPAICIIFGLQGSGKTTISNKLKLSLKKRGLKKIKVIDGDYFRNIIKNYKYDSKSRKYVGEKKYQYALKYYRRKYFVIISSVTGMPSIQLKFPKPKKINFFKIHLYCSRKDRLKRLKRNKPDLLAMLKKQKIYFNKKNCDIKVNTSKHNINKTIKKIENFWSYEKL